MKTITNIIYPAIAVFAVACLALSPGAQAVSPAPDGGYPGANTAEGDSALLSLTSGAFNTAVGFLSLQSNTTGNFNTAIGADTLPFNTANNNTATGAGALLSNTTGGNNTANGALALENNTTGSYNTASGAFALLHNAASSNTATGYKALFSNTSGHENTADGAFALLNNTGDYNTANGHEALFSNTTGGGNTATGAGALSANTVGMANTAIGASALTYNTSGQENTAIGWSALLSNTRGQDNTAIGFALSGNTTGSANTAIGSGALGQQTTGDLNTALGAGAGTNVYTANNVICIGAYGNNVSNSCYIGNIFGATSSNGAAVFVNSNGRLGTLVSSRRFKEKIRPAGKASEGLYALQPVTFHYKRGIDPEGTDAPQFGLVAEDVEEVNPDLVVRDKEGKPYSVRYDQVNAMLLNEFLKEHRKVEKLQNDFQTSVAQQQKEIGALTTQLKEQATEIQEVRAQVELRKPASQTVANDR
jgi:hypothetical protein